MTMSAAHGALNIFYSIFLSDHGYSKLLVGGLWSLGVVAEIAVFFFMSQLMRRVTLRTILLSSFLAAVVRFVIIGWCVEFPLVMALAQLLHGLTFGAFHAAAIAAVNRWFPGRTRSRGQALYSSLTFGAGGLLGGLISGWTWGHLGAELTFALSSVYALIGLILVAGWIRENDVGEPKPSRVVDTPDLV
jgi:PPP family 3-phenylpropionic acid transporter